MATLTETQTTLAAYKSERDTILASGVEEMSVGEMRYRNLRLKELEEFIDKYERQVAELSNQTGFGVVKMRGFS